LEEGQEIGESDSEEFESHGDKSAQIDWHPFGGDWLPEAKQLFRNGDHPVGLQSNLFCQYLFIYFQVPSL
jgi:hypothetical protein